MPKEPPPDPPPPPAKQVVQVQCIPWRAMNFRIEVAPQYLTIAELETIVHGRHGDPIQNLVLYKDDIAKENLLPSGSEDAIPSTKLYYDYYPPLDPFANRPVAGEMAMTNPVLRTTCNEEWQGELEPPQKGVPPAWKASSKWKNTTEVNILGGVRAASKTAEFDPHTARLMAEEAARIKAEEEARAAAAAAEAARIAAEKKAAADEKARKAAEAAAKKKAQEEEEAREAAAAEAERMRKAEEAAMNDPVKRAELEKKKAEAEAARLKAEAEAKLAALPKRSKGGAVPLFLGGTTKEYYGLDKCNKENPYLCIPCEKMLAEILDKGKIADLYNSKAVIEAYDGKDKEMLFCKDEDEVYSDEGFVLCIKDADKQHFIAHLAAGNGIPPPIK